MTLSARPTTLNDWLEVFNQSLPRRIFVQEVEQDLSQLASISRVLLCLPEDRLQAHMQQFPRFMKAVHALLHAPIWLDTLMRNPGLLISCLPLLRLYQRSGGPHMGQVMLPVHRLLMWQDLQQTEWMPPHLLEVAVSLQELGVPFQDVQQVYQTTVLDIHTPAWMWCYEKTSVLDYLLKVACAARLPVPSHWHLTCQTELLHALKVPQTRTLSTALLNYTLTGGRNVRLMEQAVQTLTQLEPKSQWEAAVSSAELVTALTLMEVSHG